MEIRELGELFIDTLLIGPSDASEIEENHDVPDEEDFEDDRSHFTTETVDDATATDIYGNLETPPTDEDAAELASQIDEPTQNPRNPPLKLLSRRTLGELSHSKSYIPIMPKNLLLHQYHQMEQFQRVDPWHRTNSKQKGSLCLI